MAPTLTALERFLERLVERPIGRLFRAPVELEQISRRVERAMEEGRRSESGRTMAPDRFRVLLHGDDLAALTRRTTDAASELGEVAHAYARRRGWQLRTRPVVSLHASTAVARGDMAVSGSITPRPTTGGSIADGQPAAGLDVTAVLPTAAIDDLSLVVSSRGRPDRRIVLAGAVLRIGRAMDNEVVLADERVSRHHGVIITSQGMLVYRDLASANGSYLRGQRVSEVALGPGDELTLGSTSLRLSGS
ncbi:MAG: FhaA domain-containing protein [Candidatus Limnocylindrales bacterium]|jgi:hypothetical protein